MSRIAHARYLKTSMYRALYWQRAAAREKEWAGNEKKGGTEPLYEQTYRHNMDRKEDTLDLNRRTKCINIFNKRRVMAPHHIPTKRPHSLHERLEAASTQTRAVL